MCYETIGQAGINLGNKKNVNPGKDLPSLPRSSSDLLFALVNVTGGFTPSSNQTLTDEEAPLMNLSQSQYREHSLSHTTRAVIEIIVQSSISTLNPAPVPGLV